MNGGTGGDRGLGSQGFPLRQPGPPRRRWRYALAAVSACAAVGLRALLGEYFAPPYLLPLAAVMLSASFGGLGPGVLATLLSTVLVYLTLFEPVFTIYLNNPRDLIGLAVFVTIGVATSATADRLRKANRHAAQQAEDLHEALAAKSASEERFRALIERSSDVTMVVDEKGRFTFVSPAFETVIGIPPSQVIGRSAFDLNHPDDAPQAMEALAAAIRNPGTTQQVRVRVRRHDGSWALLGASITNMLAVPGVRGIVVNNRDISEQSTLEQRLAVASRLAAMGTLVAGVAHEINNPLTGVVAGLGTAKLEAKSNLEKLEQGERPGKEALIQQNEEMLEVLGDASEAASRITAIVKDLSVFGAPTQEWKRLRPSDILEGALRWIPSSVTRVARVSVEDSGAPEVLASRGQLEQVLVNLITNAAKATRPGETGSILVRIGEGPPGRARLEVVDHGIGIPSTNLDKIFDPFFTTRPAGEGRGSGLGLAICHAILMAHGGTITVQSEVGKGSTFRVELPAAPDGGVTLHSHRIPIATPPRLPARPFQRSGTTGGTVTRGPRCETENPRVPGSIPGPGTSTTRADISGPSDRKIGRALLGIPIVRTGARGRAAANVSGPHRKVHPRGKLPSDGPGQVPDSVRLAASDASNRFGARPGRVTGGYLPRLEQRLQDHGGEAPGELRLPGPGRGAAHRRAREGLRADAAWGGGVLRRLLRRPSVLRAVRRRAPTR